MAGGDPGRRRSAGTWGSAGDSRIKGSELEKTAVLRLLRLKVTYRLHASWKYLDIEL
jgi:hypothetical protein